MFIVSFPSAVNALQTVWGAWDTSTPNPAKNLSGFAVSAARLASPDAGLIAFGEMADQGRMINAAVKFPVIADADTGYGNALNVKQTLQGYIQAGFAGLLLEDQGEVRAFCKVAPGVLKMANILEGGGKTPILFPLELEDIGFRVVVYPLSLVGVSIRAMQSWTALET